MVAMKMAGEHGATLWSPNRPVLDGISERIRAALPPLASLVHVTHSAILQSFCSFRKAGKTIVHGPVNLHNDIQEAIRHPNASTLVLRPYCETGFSQSLLVAIRLAVLLRHLLSGRPR